MKKRALSWGIVGLVLLLMSAMFLVACGEGTTDTTAAATDTTAAASGGGTDTTAASDATADTTAASVSAGDGDFAGDITIGVLCALTGANAMTGAEQKWAQEKAASDINDAGGVTLADGKKYRLKLVFADDQSDAIKGAEAVERLIKVENTKLILGTQVTPINMSAGIVAEKYGAVYSMVMTWTDFFREQNYKWCVDTFTSTTSAAELQFLAIETQPEAERPKKLGIMVHDDADGRGLGDGFAALAKEHNMEVAAYEAYTMGTKDFSSSILKLKQAGVEALFCLFSPSDGITFVKQMKEQNFSPKFIAGWKGFWPMEFAEALGSDSDYFVHDGFWFEGLPYPGAAELGQAFRDAHGGTDSVSVGLLYSVVQVMARAIEAAGSTDPAAVRAEIAGKTFKDTTMGDLTYADDGACDFQFVSLIWKDGKRHVLYPVQEENPFEFTWFPAWDKR